MNPYDITLIDINDIRALGRPMTRLKDDDDVSPFIKEAQTVHIRTQLTNSLYLNVVKWVIDPTDMPDYTALMQGGVYESTGSSCGCGPVIFEGIKKALVYYTQALMIQNPNFITRFGIVQKQDAYNSVNAELKQRIAYENGTRSAADLFMKNTLKYIAADRDTFPDDGTCCGTRPRQKANIKVRIIGD